MSSAPRSPLRQLLESRISQLSTEVESLFAETRERGRWELLDQLNQTVRRLRQSEDIESLGATLVDAAGCFATVAAWFQVEDGLAKGRRIQGVPEETSEPFKSLEIPLSAAAALGGAVETRDPVVALSSAAEVSEDLVQLVGHTPAGRVSIFPLVVTGNVPALLYCWGTVEGSAIELLAQVASGVWAELARPAPVEFVQIAAAAMAPASEPAPAPEPASPAPAPREAPSWEGLTPEEQQVHFRAQRFARVQVAEMRLYQAEAVQAGRSRAGLYEALREPIDSARDKFRQEFFGPCSSMVDYLHLELVRTLANDDPDLLGKEYPGPMA